MWEVGRIKADECPFKLTCQNCFLELTIYVPDQYSIAEYINITKPFLNSQLNTITKQKDSLYLLKTNNGQTLKDVNFKLTYLCDVEIEDTQQTTQQLQSQNLCPNYKNIEESQLTIKTIIYKKPKTNQEIKLPIEKLS